MGKALTFADRLGRAVADAKITPYALAKRAGLTRQAVANLIAGERQPNWNTVQRLAAALGLDCRAFSDPVIVDEVAAAPPAKGRGRPPADQADGAARKQPARRK